MLTTRSQEEKWMTEGVWTIALFCVHPLIILELACSQFGHSGAICLIPCSAHDAHLDMHLYMIWRIFCSLPSICSSVSSEEAAISESCGWQLARVRLRKLGVELQDADTARGGRSNLTRLMCHQACVDVLTVQSEGTCSFENRRQ